MYRSFNYSSQRRHDATVAVIDIPVELSHCYSREVWKYKHADFNKFNHLIDEFNWNTAFENCNNVREACEFFTKTYTDLAKKCIPIKTVTTRPNDK